MRLASGWPCLISSDRTTNSYCAQPGMGEDVQTQCSVGVKLAQSIDSVCRANMKTNAGNVRSSTPQPQREG